MIYADYAYYTGAYGGKNLNQEDFDRMALRASVYIDLYTNERAEEQAELPAVKLACCALAEQFMLMERADEIALRAMEKSEGEPGRELTGETVGSHSVTWQAGSESAAAAMTAADGVQLELKRVARQYLAGTGLLYRGGRCHVCAGHGDGI